MAEHDPDIDLIELQFATRRRLSTCALRALTPDGDLTDALAACRSQIFTRDALTLYDLLLEDERPGLREDLVDAQTARDLHDHPDTPGADVDALPGEEDTPTEGIAGRLARILHRALSSPTRPARAASRPDDVAAQLQEHTRQLIEREDFGALISYTCWLMDTKSLFNTHTDQFDFISGALPCEAPSGDPDPDVFPLDTRRFDRVARACMGAPGAHAQAHAWRQFTHHLLMHHGGSPRLKGWLNLLADTLGPREDAHALTCLTVGLDLYHAGHTGPSRQLLELANHRVNP